MDYLVKIKIKNPETGSIEYEEQNCDDYGIMELLDRLNRFEIIFFTVRNTTEDYRRHLREENEMNKRSEFDENMLNFIV